MNVYLATQTCLGTPLEQVLSLALSLDMGCGSRYYPLFGHVSGLCKSSHYEILVTICEQFTESYLQPTSDTLCNHNPQGYIRFLKRRYITVTTTKHKIKNLVHVSYLINNTSANFFICHSTINVDLFSLCYGLQIHKTAARQRPVFTYLPV